MFFVVAVVACVAACCAVIFLVLASCTDPGIIPRRDVILACPGLRESLKERFGQDLLNNDEFRPNANVSLELKRQGFSWCSTCQIVKVRGPAVMQV